MDRELTSDLVHFVQYLRELKLDKSPGIAESIDWANGLAALGAKKLSEDYIRATLGCVLKSDNDIQLVKGQNLQELLTDAEA